RPGLRRHIDDSARGAAVFGREVVGYHAVFPNRVDGYLRANDVGENGYVFHTVEQDFRAGFSLSVDRIAHTASCCARARANARVVGTTAVRGEIPAAHVPRKRDKIIGVSRETRER